MIQKESKMNDVKFYYKSELEEATSALGSLEERLNQASNESTNNIDLQSTRKKVCEPAGSSTAQYNTGFTIRPASFDGEIP